MTDTKEVQAIPQAPAIELDQPPESIAHDLASNLEWYLDSVDSSDISDEERLHLTVSRQILERLAGMKS